MTHYKIIEIERPLSVTYTIGTSAKDIDITKPLIIEFSHETKTKIYSSLSIGTFRAGINLRIEGFKTFEKEKFNYFNCKTQQIFLFVKSKKQDYEAYKRYLIECVKTLPKEFQRDEIFIYKKEF